jgi:ribosome-associated heat shock protein Hsp15
MKAQSEKPPENALQSMRLDKWLWAARFFKTRGLAQQAIEAGRVLVDGERVKVARALKAGERVTVRIGDQEQQVQVISLSEQRGPATTARTLYQETEQSIARRAEAATLRRLAPEPAWTIEQGRPTKRDRRQIERLKGWPGSSHE